MESEEGEILEPGVSTPGDYDPLYEWPGGSPTTSFPCSDPLPISQCTSIALRPNQPTFRLIVLRTSILSSKHRVGVIDGHSEIQFGRDVVPAGSKTPKIRLKEMQVSKLHATAYWDARRREWGVVDMGSVHGTFLKPANTTGDNPGTRLSPPRQASIPRKLSHMDQLTIGGTTFLLHMHQDRLPCEECQTDGRYDIPLYPISKSSKSTAAESSVGTSKDPDDSGFLPLKAPADPKKALSLLKKSLLTRHSDSSLRQSASFSVDNAPTQYVDRSARRRALMPATQPDAPGVSTTPSFVSLEAPASTPRSKSPSVEPTSQPPVPLPSSNIGHRLLMKQGWEPGTALGSPFASYEGQVGLVEPIEPTVSLQRGGLGLKRASTTSLPTLSDQDWKETGKRRRWDRS
ncbi:hypothetical protein C0989_007473 [Termitomyces sp. Mn162]|nr:hypothetical protein C0989_007473 [Termitomyces sp. Mn162]KAH0585428.1 hypothetical protein H2248_008669 [Termitomyces sp. 'cryptogamus']